MKWFIASAFLLPAGSVTAQERAKSDSVQVQALSGKERLVSGTIINSATQKGVVGARVQVEGFSAAITDAAGQFKLKVPSLDATLTIGGEGFNTSQVPLNGRETLSVTLIDDSFESMYEPVVTPNGPRPKSTLPYSIAQYDVTGWQNVTETPDALL
ncbi:MAG TPA: carboxypeptidase-like regulatory domain-containing protein, partial [Flavisolibacter sp.]|nr:carboxypeptidase-like regulatory domain-containing protein [Flavisolibacter sp.]